MAWKLDEIDRKIIELLRENANIPNQKLGKRIGLSEPAARRRVGNLVKRGVIRRFTIDVEEGGGVSALMLISTSPHVQAAKIMASLAKEPGVSSIWETSGDLDVAVSISAQDMDSLNRRIDEIRNIDGVRKTKTSIILKKWK